MPGKPALVPSVLREAFEDFYRRNPAGAPQGAPMLEWEDMTGHVALFRNGIQGAFLLGDSTRECFVPYSAVTGIWRWRFGGRYAVSALPASDRAGIQLETSSGLVLVVDDAFVKPRRAEETLHVALGERWNEVYKPQQLLWSDGFRGSMGKHALVRGSATELPADKGTLLIREGADSVRSRAAIARLWALGLIGGGTSLIVVAFIFTRGGALPAQAGQFAVLSLTILGFAMALIGALQGYRYARLKPFAIWEGGIEVPPRWGDPIGYFVPFSEVTGVRTETLAARGTALLLDTREGLRVAIPPSFKGAAAEIAARVPAEPQSGVRSP